MIVLWIVGVFLALYLIGGIIQYLDIHDTGRASRKYLKK